MRDPKRIEKILQLIRCYWLAHPDLRLGQLVVNCCLPGADVFYVEDNVLEKTLIDELERMSMQ